MRKNGLLCLLAFVMVALLAVSCSKDEGSGDGDAGRGNIALRVRAVGSADASTEMTVAKPISIYVFDEADKCVALSTVSGESDGADFRLATGRYAIYAVAGADADSYSLPQKDTATPESVVALRSGKRHADLMCASKNVELVDGEDNSVTLEMSRMVFQLVSVCVNNVPDDVVDITATIQPFCENIKVNGEYSGAQGMEQLTLSRVGNTSTWRNDCKLFLLPSVGKPEIQFSIVTKTGKKSFKTTGGSELVANYRVEINVDYVSAPTLKCNIKGVEWGETRQWNFTIDSSELVDEGGSDGDTETGDAPEVGSAYKGCYVLKSETVGNGTRVTLLNPKAKDLTFSAVDQNAVSTIVDSAISGLAVDGVEGWRLPSQTEMEWLNENKKTLSKALADLGMTTVYDGKYLFIDDGGLIKSFITSTGLSFDLAKSYKYTLRPLATVTFYKQ